MFFDEDTQTAGDAGLDSDEPKTPVSSDEPATEDDDTQAV
jgi:hypothetical protein